MSRSFYIETFGCQMNKGDSELIKASMEQNGFIPAADAGNADIRIYNTCSVRQNAEDRAAARMREGKNSRQGKKTLIVATGCMAQRVGEELVSQGIADIAIGPYQSPACGEIVSEFISRGDITVYSSQEKEDFHDRLGNDIIQNREMHPWHKWVTITHGCENFCSYCIVPYVRGRLISFPSERILKYIRDLTEEGVIEISLLGQNVNQYGHDSGDIPFYRLLDKAADIKGIERVNFLTSHPMDFSREIVSVIKNHSNISRGIHLPLQSGSDRILGMMNRKYNMAHYLKITEFIAEELPDYALSTDLITGYPGETDQDFNETLKAVEKIRFDEAFMYAYSPRSGTPAADEKELLSRKEKIDRLNQLISLQRKISLEKLKLRINKKESVIAEKLSKRSSSEIMGKTDLAHPVVFKGDINDIGRKIEIEVRDIKGSTLCGEKVS